MSRPLPPSAVHIFSSGPDLIVQLSTPKGNVVELTFQSTPGGFAALHRFLREREKLNSPAKFATPAAPTQHIVDAWHHDPAARDKAERAAERAERERFASKTVKEQCDELSALFDL